MSKGETCPRCGAVNKPKAYFCKGCGRVLLRCPECGSLNTDAVMFCVKCGKALPSGKESANTEMDSGKKPYLVWEGWPFAWLARTSQTKAQAYISLAIFAIYYAITVPIFLYASKDAGEGLFCLASFLMIIVAPLAVWVWWLSGREGAEEEEEEEWEREEV